jgi:uncharacterized protein YyaL (SSP411 family)
MERIALCVAAFLGAAAIQGEAMNRLQHEKSPYLLQHAGNPVDWYPWGEEAFAAARRENKPVFLSIGYSTCHWCHVMAHESFEDPEVAAALNEVFVPVKVDREERPDVDELYMTACQLLTGQGGWPLTVFLTPEGKPFFAATYIPKEGRYGMSGLLELIPRVRELWRTQAERIEGSAEQILAALRQAAEPGQAGEAPGPAVLGQAFQDLLGGFDREQGGFGGAPKFPAAHTFSFLLTRREPEALEMVEKTLRAMRAGGIYDQVGLGFHRYATDARWRVPHYEKMLYDQALLALAYTEAWQLTGRPLYRRTAEETFTYVLRDLTSPEGAFYSAEDADSEGEEGRFYRWTGEELSSLLEDGELALVGLEEGTLHLLDPERPLSEASRARLLAHRAARVRPGRDDKVLASWNGLMIAAFARAAGAFDRPDYALAAARAARFVLGTLRDPQGELLHRWRDGQAAIPAFAEDYACLAWGMLELYQAGFEPWALESAFELTDRLLDRHADPQGGFFQSAEADQPGGIRLQPTGDGALPSANSVALRVLLRLSRIGDRPAYWKAAEDLLRRHSAMVRRHPQGFTFLLAGLDFYLGPSSEVVLAGRAEAEDTAALARALRRAFLPRAVFLLRPTGQAEPSILRLAPFARDYGAGQDGRARAFVCRNYTCRLPTGDAREMLALLAEP